MSDLTYYLLCGVLVAGVLGGIAMMSQVKTASRGNLLSALCTAGAVVVTLVRYHILTVWALWAWMAAGLALGLFWASRIKMIQMPQAVALFNGFGGAGSALVAAVSMADGEPLGAFGRLTGGLALGVGVATLTGSLVAAGKLHQLLAQKPVVWRGHRAITTLSLVATLGAAALLWLLPGALWLGLLIGTLASALFGVAFAIRVGGADMPITISLLNSLSGVAGAIAGMAIGDPLLVAIGGVVGASGLLLTQIMCRSMNRRLGDILTGATGGVAPATGGVAPATAGVAPATGGTAQAEPQGAAEPSAEPPAAKQAPDLGTVVGEARRVIIIPGYGMALAQAQQTVKEISDRFEARGAQVDFAIHPVAGRMPGHMNVLLAEAEVPYEKLREMEEINPAFPDCDLAIIIGANDVVNPAAGTAEGTPIYGMPILNADQAKWIVICNYDRSPGYAGVENPLYQRDNAILLLGDAAETLQQILALLP